MAASTAYTYRRRRRLWTFVRGTGVPIGTVRRGHVLHVHSRRNTQCIVEIDRHLIPLLWFLDEAPRTGTAARVLLPVARRGAAPHAS
jgi:hypothetical protein